MHGPLIFSNGSEIKWVNFLLSTPLPSQIIIWKP